MPTLKILHDTQQPRADFLHLLESLKKHAVLEKEVEFEKKLKALMKRYDKTREDIMVLQEHSVSALPAHPGRQRRRRIDV